MAKTPFDDYLRELEFQREVWNRKAALRAVYHYFFRRVCAQLSPLGPTVEIGSGCGNFKEYRPEIIATDVVKSGPWIDQIVDAQQLPYAAGTIGNFVAIDVLHHLQRPLDFLRQAAVCLQPGGRIVLLEPAATRWSRLVYGRNHHEPVDLTWDLFGLDGTPPVDDPGHTFANMGIAALLFARHPQETLRRVPALALTKCSGLGFLTYPATGGFSYRGFVPGGLVPALCAVEDCLLRPVALHFTGMRYLVVLTKR